MMIITGVPVSTTTTIIITITKDTMTKWAIIMTQMHQGNFFFLESVRSSDQVLC